MRAANASRSPGGAYGGGGRVGAGGRRGDASKCLAGCGWRCSAGGCGLHACLCAVCAREPRARKSRRADLGAGERPMRATSDRH